MHTVSFIKLVRFVSAVLSESFAALTPFHLARNSAVQTEPFQMNEISRPNCVICHTSVAT